MIAKFAGAAVLVTPAKAIHAYSNLTFCSPSVCARAYRDVERKRMDNIS